MLSAFLYILNYYPSSSWVSNTQVCLLNLSDWSWGGEGPNGVGVFSPVSMRTWQSCYLPSIAICPALLWHVPALGGKNKDPTMNFISMFATIPTPQDVSQLIMSATRSYTRAYPISDCIKGFRPSAHQMDSSSSYSFWEKGAVRVPVDGFSGAGYYRTSPHVSVITSQCLMDNIPWHCFSCFRTSLSFFVLWWQE